MIKKYGDVYASIFLMVFAVIMYVATYSIQRLTISQIGSEFVPRLVAVGIFLCSAALLIKGIRSLKQQSTGGQTKQEEVDAQTKEENSSFRAFPVVATLVLLVFYIALIREIGFLIMTVIYLFLQFYVLAHKSKRSFPLFLILSVVVSVTVYYVFRYGFHLMLPAGILG